MRHARLISILDNRELELYATERLVSGLALIQVSNKGMRPADVDTERTTDIDNKGKADRSVRCTQIQQPQVDKATMSGLVANDD